MKMQSFGVRKHYASCVETLPYCAWRPSFNKLDGKGIFANFVALIAAITCCCIAVGDTV